MYFHIAFFKRNILLLNIYNMKRIFSSSIMMSFQLNNSNFGDYVDHIYPIEIEIKEYHIYS
jgi:hypothetical protein